MSSRSAVAALWDAAAASFDEQPDHGLGDPRVRDAWARRLASWLPDPPATVLDLGCGTGSLSVLVAGQGHRVVGVDVAPAMIEHARRKLAAAGRPAGVVVGEATAPPVLERSVDAILVRHLVWAMPDPPAALRRWVGLARPGGRLLLVEGRWGGAGDYPHALPWAGGVPARTLAATLAPLVSGLRVEPLPDPDLWGHPIDDERYAVIATV